MTAIYKTLFATLCGGYVVNGRVRSAQHSSVSYLLTALWNLVRLRHDSLLHLTTEKDRSKNAEKRGENVKIISHNLL